MSFAVPKRIAVNLCEMNADPSHVVFEKPDLAAPSDLAAGPSCFLESGT